MYIICFNNSSIRAAAEYVERGHEYWKDGTWNEIKSLENDVLEKIRMDNNVFIRIPEPECESKKYDLQNYQDDLVQRFASVFESYIQMVGRNKGMTTAFSGDAKFCIPSILNLMNGNEILWRSEEEEYETQATVSQRR